jgi:dTDP-4-amino-4,6-dideoxygalactose transaminase
MRTELAQCGVETLIHYPKAPHLQKAYRDLGLCGGTFPIAEELQQQVLSLPMHPCLTDRQIDEVIRACRLFCHAPGRVRRAFTSRAA